MWTPRWTRTRECDRVSQLSTTATNAWDDPLLGRRGLFQLMISEFSQLMPDRLCWGWWWGKGQNKQTKKKKTKNKQKGLIILGIEKPEERSSWILFPLKAHP